MESHDAEYAGSFGGWKSKPKTAACSEHNFDAEALGISEAKRRLANCLTCGHPRFAACHPDQRAVGGGER